MTRRRYSIADLSCWWDLSLLNIQVMRILFNYCVCLSFLSVRAPPIGLGPSPRKGSVCGLMKKSDVSWRHCWYRTWSRLLVFVFFTQVFIAITAFMLHTFSNLCSSAFLSCNYWTARHSAFIPVFIWKKFPKYTWERSHDMWGQNWVHITKALCHYPWMEIFLIFAFPHLWMLQWHGSPYSEKELGMNVSAKMSQTRKHRTAFRWIWPRTV